VLIDFEANKQPVEMGYNRVTTSYTKETGHYTAILRVGMKLFRRMWLMC